MPKYTAHIRTANGAQWFHAPTTEDLRAQLLKHFNTNWGDEEGELDTDTDLDEIVEAIDVYEDCSWTEVGLDPEHIALLDASKRLVAERLGSRSLNAAKAYEEVLAAIGLHEDQYFIATVAPAAA